MRTLAVAVVLASALAACGSDPQPAIETDAHVADAPDGGGGELDAGDATDSGSDAGPVDAGAVVVDAGHDIDAGPRDGGPPDLGVVDAGLCVVFPQSGCVDGLACRYQYSGGVRTGRACEPAGTDRDGWTCMRLDGGGDTCMPGLWCSVTCRRSCLVDADCPPDISGRARHCDLPGGTVGPLCVVTL